MSVFFALIAAVALLLAGSARADLLAYNCAYDICTVDPDAPPTEATNLTHTSDDVGAEFSPAWSPDGKSIAYAGAYDGVKEDLYQTWVLDPSVPAEDLEPVLLSDIADAQPELNDPPVWSPDGSLVAFEEIYLSGRPHGNEHHIYVSPFDGSSDPVLIGSLTPQGQSTHPSWTPDGRIVFGLNSLFIANSDGTGISPFASPVTSVTNPTVSPDGRYVVVETPSNPSNVVVYKTDGTLVGTMPKPGSQTTTDISWSPDSTRIVYSYHETSDHGLWVGPVANPSAGHVQKAPTGWVNEFNASFSPDATRIAFDAASTQPGQYTQIFIAPAGGGDAKQITSANVGNREPSWKPCEGCIPVPPSEGGSGNPPGTGGGGGATPKPAGAAKVPVKLKLSALGATGGPHFMTLSGINCKAEGGHPELLPPELRKACNVSAFTEYTVDNHTLHRVQLKSSAIVFAKGSAKIPEGESKPLKLKLTGAGKKYAKAGKTLKLALTIKMTAPDQKPQKLKKTIRVKVTGA